MTSEPPSRRDPAGNDEAERLRRENHDLKRQLQELKGPADPEPHARLLLGFSKSGWGAFSLLLRYPERFGKAAAWDAPLMQERPDRFGMGEILGTHLRGIKPTTISR